jgi:methylated-DNA-[protein]-cysteine S-methyltransferase
VKNVTEVAMARIGTAQGPAWVMATERGVREIRLGASGRPSGRVLRAAGLRLVHKPRWTEPVQRELESYFAGAPVSFHAPLDLGTGTSFERRVWEVTRRVPYGAVTSYGSIAAHVGSPRAARAVGNALGQNPVPILIPCHRVILGSLAMGGFSGGLTWKRYLLELEQGQLEMSFRARSRLALRLPGT